MAELLVPEDLIHLWQAGHQGGGRPAGSGADRPGGGGRGGSATQPLCDEIGADFYAANATGTMTRAKEFLPA